MNNKNKTTSDTKAAALNQSRRELEEYKVYGDAKCANCLGKYRSHSRPRVKTLKQVSVQGAAEAQGCNE